MLKFLYNLLKWHGISFTWRWYGRQHSKANRPFNLALDQRTEANKEILHNIKAVKEKEADR